MACNCNSCEECETCGNCSSDCESTSCDELQTSLSNTADKINYLAVFKNVPAPLLRDTLLKLECDLASLATMVCEGGATTIDWSSVTEKPFDSLNPDDFTVIDGVLNIGGDLADPVTIEDVDALPSPPDGDSNTFYRLPDGTVYVLNQIGDGWVDLTGGGSDINPDDFQVYKLTADDGKALRVSTLDSIPETMDELIRPGYYYITTTESQTFIPEDSYLREIGLAGAGWITVYPGDPGGVVIQEWSRNTADKDVHSRHLYRKQASSDPIEWYEWTEYAQSTAQLKKLTNDDGSSFRLEDLETAPENLEQWARMYKGFFYLPNSDLITMADFDTLPESFADSHVHMTVQSDSDNAYALQTITQCQAPYIQLYRVVTSTSAARWQVVVTSEMLDGTLEVPVIPTIATTLPHELDKIDQILNDIEGVIEDDE